VNLVFELSSVRILAPSKQERRLLARQELSGNSMHMVLLVERYLRNRTDYSKAKIDVLCRHILPQ